MNPAQCNNPKPATITFNNPATTTVKDIESELRKRAPSGNYVGAVVYEELKHPNGDYKGLIHIGNPYSDGGHMRITTLETRCTRAELENIRKKIVWFPEACALFEILASNFYLRQNLALEGPSSLGKTWLSEKFIECVFGPGIRPIYMSCNKDLQARDLFAKWAPRDSSEIEPKIKIAVDAWLKTTKGEESRKQITELQEALSDADPAAVKTIIDGEYLAIAEKLGLLKNKSEYVREYGPVPQAYLAKIESDGSISFPESGGRGLPFFADELTRGKPDLHNGFISIRGSNRQLKPQLTMQELGGRTVARGEDTWFLAALNPADEDFEGVTKIDPALARAFAWVVLKDLSPESYRMAATSFLAFDRDDKPAPMIGHKPFEYMSNRELLTELGEVLAHLHLGFKERFGAWMRQRDQKIPTTLDDMASFAKQIYLYPVLKPSGAVDVAESIRQAFRNCYMEKFNDEKLSAEFERDLEAVLTNKATASKRWRGATLTREQILNKLGEELTLPLEERRKLAMADLASTVKDATGNKMVPPSVRAELESMFK